MTSISIFADERAEREIYGAYILYDSKCDGEFKGRSPTIEELKTVLQSHAEWIPLIGKQNYGKLLEDPRRANLCGADLSGATMQKIDLNTANLTKANLKDSKLTYSNLSTANLIKADLSSADLVGVNLSYAKLEGANLSDAILIGADLSNAYLMGSDLSGAYLAGANLRGVLFEPKPGSLPNIEAAAEAANLHKLLAIDRRREPWFSFEMRSSKRDSVIKNVKSPLQ